MYDRQFNNAQYNNHRRQYDDRERSRTKYVIVGSVVVIVMCVASFLLWRNMRSDGMWVCDGNEWVMRGETTDPRPAEGCRDGVAQDVSVRTKPEQEFIDADSKKITQGIDIRVMSPHVNQTITSPIRVKGEAKDWFVEDEIIVRIMDESGNTIAEQMVTAKGDAEDGYITFEDDITFDPQDAKSGDVVFHRNNPTNDPAQSRTFSFPIFFE